MIAIVVPLGGCLPDEPAPAGTATTPAAHAPVDVEWRDEHTATITYVDVAGSPRSIIAQLRPPSGTAPVSGWPVVVWSHGGADGKDAIARVGDGWTTALHIAGHLVVAIAHPGRDLDERELLCAAIGIDDCDRFKYLTWDRPNDAAVVFDWLESLVADGATFDLDRLVYGGHSAGSVSVLTVAGMTGHVPGDVQPPSDPRPVAFLAASPPGATTLSLDDTSLAAIDRPVLMLTGAGDDTDGSVGLDRRTTFELLPPGDHRLVWIDDPRARHTTFDLDLDACRRSGGTRAECRTLARTIADDALAWLALVNGP